MTDYDPAATLGQPKNLDSVGTEAVASSPTLPPAPLIEVMMVSGLSGAGKTVAQKTLEDCGYYCIDHLPADLLVSTLYSLKKRGETRIAIGLDLWDPDFMTLANAHWANLGTDYTVRTLFLEAQENTLLNRYHETRRQHPLQKLGMTLPEALIRERHFLQQTPRGAFRIDTTDLSVHSLRHLIKDYLQLKQHKMRIVVQSFGFKHGPCLDADMSFDVRCLPNPYYQLHLRPLTGKDQAVQDFFGGHERVNHMIDHIEHFVTQWKGDYESDHRENLTIGIGCTGGQHRSVFIAESVTARLQALGLEALSRHRESGRWPCSNLAKTTTKTIRETFSDPSHIDAGATDVTGVSQGTASDQDHNEVNHSQNHQPRTPL